jgi:hypothetical protein
MNKRLVVRILSGVCLVLSVLVTYFAFDFASTRALSGQDPMAWIGVGAFFVAITLVVVAITLQTKYN